MGQIDSVLDEIRVRLSEAEQKSIKATDLIDQVANELDIPARDVAYALAHLVNHGHLVVDDTYGVALTERDAVVA
jgi:hypothetical protein